MINGRPTGVSVLGALRANVEAAVTKYFRQALTDVWLHGKLDETARPSQHVFDPNIFDAHADVV